MTTIIVAVIGALASIASAYLISRQGRKVSATHKTLTQNSFKSTDLTILDRIDMLSKQVGDVNKRVTQIERKME